MTDKKIQQLAREYARITAFDGGLVNPDDMEREYQNGLPVIQWLAESHCIVSRENVKKLCRLTVENGISIDYGLIDGLTDLVCDMFNEEYLKEMDDYDLYLKGARNEQESK